MSLQATTKLTQQILRRFCSISLPCFCNLYQPQGSAVWSWNMINREDQGHTSKSNPQHDPVMQGVLIPNLRTLHTLANPSTRPQLLVKLSCWETSAFAVHFGCSYCLATVSTVLQRGALSSGHSASSFWRETAPCFQNACSHLQTVYTTAWC